MLMEINEKDLKSGVLGLVVALVEIIKETLNHQAVKLLEAGRLTEEEVERLGEALMDMDEAIRKIEVEVGITESVRSIREGLDRAVDDAIDTILNPGRWNSASEYKDHER